jgi:1,4-alpha-glucan branching enzyme
MKLIEEEQPQIDLQTEQKAAENPKIQKRGKRRLLFEVEAPTGSEVFVAGSFNGWELNKHRLTDKAHPGKYRRHVYVEPGTIEYKFLIDGKWQIDSKCTRWTPNDFGTLNSVTEAS